MKVKNVSSRLHHVGNVSIAPGEEKEIPKGFETAINKDELVEVKDELVEVKDELVEVKDATPVAPVVPKPWAA